jgi:hypothetical protein
VTSLIANIAKIANIPKSGHDGRTAPISGFFNGFSLPNVGNLATRGVPAAGICPLISRFFS